MIFDAIQLPDNPGWGRRLKRTIWVSVNATESMEVYVMWNVSDITERWWATLDYIIIKQFKSKLN